MARRRQRRLLDAADFQGSGRFLAERLNTLGMSQNEFARQLGKGAAKDVNQWFGSGTRPPRRPSWDSVVQIARVLDMPFDTVRIAMGYRSPNEVEPQPLDGWDLETLRLARQLLNLLRRVPPAARPDVQLAVSASLSALAAELERIGAQVDEPLP